MVLRPGVLETQGGSEVDALADYGLSALSPGHTSASHMVSYILTEYQYENLIIPFQFKEPVNPLLQWILDSMRF